MKQTQNKTWGRIVLVTTGVLSLVWFLVRVIPKPSRATYPCQRAAFPIAASFVIWLTTVITSLKVYKKSKVLFASNSLKALMYMVIAGLIFGLSFFVQPMTENIANAYGPLAFDPNEYEKVDMQEKTEAVLSELPATVGISSIEDEDNITYSQLETMMREAVALAGGLNDIVDDGDYVVLKPNVVGVDNEDLKKGFRGHITHNWVVEIAAKLVRELNPKGEIVVMENSFTITIDELNKLKYDTIKYLDAYYALDDISGGWQDYSSNKLKSVSLPDSLSLYPDNKKPNKSRPIYLNKQYYNADVIISLPVMKNHMSAGITGAVKNISIGCAVGNIYGEDGGTKTNRRSTGIQHDEYSTNNLHRWIHDFLVCRPVDFAIMDAIEGHDYGPGAKNGDEKNMGLILASKDLVAMDAIQGLLMQQSPYKVNYLMYLHNNDQGFADPALIDVAGIQVPDHRTVFNHNREQTLHSRFTKTTCNNYNATVNISNGELELDLTLVDDLLARITIGFKGDSKKKYVVDKFDAVKVPIGDLNSTSGELQVVFEDKYLNRVERTFLVGNVSIESQMLTGNLDVKLYPVPVSDVLTIDVDGDRSESLSFVVYSIDGRKVMNGVMDNSKHLLDVSGLPAGDYVVRLSNKKSAIAQKRFIKR
ncbi:MAG: DUF362 domain-containing protein [Bacteroidales bacterium]|nr:DUF362 domain-containing protein [Bacteroidales bacterium]